MSTLDPLDGFLKSNAAPVPAAPERHEQAMLQRLVREKTPARRQRWLLPALGFGSAAAAAAAAWLLMVQTPQTSQQATADEILAETFEGYSELADDEEPVYELFAANLGN